MKNIIIVLSICGYTLSVAQDSNRVHTLNGKVVDSKKQATSAAPPASKDSWPSFAERFAYLSDGTCSVLIPKGAVIHLPAPGRITVQSSVVGQWVEWDEFYNRNRSALRLESVTYKQLQGLESIKPDLLLKIKSEKVPVITAYNNLVVKMPSAYLKLATP